MTKLDWTKAKHTQGALDSSSELSDRAASEDRNVLEEVAKKRRKALNKLPANWLKSNEEVCAYKEALKSKK